MFEVLQTPAYAPFAIAFVVMIGIGLIEAIGLGIGQFDLDGGMDAPDGTVLDWLGMDSGLPILIWLTSLLGCFTLTGLAIQQVAASTLKLPGFGLGKALAAAQNVYAERTAPKKEAPEEALAAR